MSVVGTISAAAAKKGLEKVIEDIYRVSKGTVRKKLDFKHADLKKIYMHEMQAAGAV